MGLLDKWIESLDYELSILPSCSRYKSPRSICSRCLDICKDHAIELVNNKPKIVKDKCNHCGECISACPVQAVEGIIPKRTVMKDKLLLSDEQLPSIKELLVLHKKGIKEIVCEEQGVMEELKNRLVEVNSVLFQLGEEPFSLSDVPLLKNEQLYSRRELLTLWKKESQSFILQAAPAKWRFNYKSLDVTKYYPEYQFTEILVNLESCTLCRACEFLCEKKCIYISETSFSITAQACSACYLCMDVCPEKAISVNENISLVYDTHYPIIKKQCDTCHQLFHTIRQDEATCVACTKQKVFSSPI